MTGPANAGVGDPACGTFGEWQSKACFRQAQDFNGAYAEWNDNTMTLGPGFTGVLTHLLTTYADFGGCGLDFVSVGLRKGGIAGNTQRWYTGSLNQAGQYNEVVRGDASPNEDLAPHSYRVRYIEASGTADVFEASVDPVGVLTAGGAWEIDWLNIGANGCRSKVGVAADQAPDGSYSISTFDATNIYRLITSTNAIYGFNASQYWIEAACGIEASPPNCYNGLYVGGDPGHWSSNKP